MARTDIEVFNEVYREWMEVNGSSLRVRTVLQMVQRLVEDYGDAFTIDSACENIADLERIAGSIRASLKKAAGGDEGGSEKPK